MKNKCVTPSSHSSCKSKAFYCKKFSIVALLLIFFDSTFLSSQPLFQNQPAVSEWDERLRQYLLQKLEHWDVIKLLRAKKKIDERKKQRATASSNPEELALLATDKNSEVRFFIDVNPHTPLEILPLLAVDPLPHVRAGVAISLRLNSLNSQSKEQTIKKIAFSLAQDSHPLVRLGLVSNFDLAPDVFEILAHDTDYLIRKKLAENIYLSQNVLEILAQDSVIAVQVQALKHRNMSTRMLIERSEDPSSQVRLALASNTNTPLDVLKRLVDDDSPEVRQAVAEHPKTSLSMLERLAEDQEIRVVVAVARHPHVDQELLLTLSVDRRSLLIREIAQKQLSQLLRSEIREDIMERW